MSEYWARILARAVIAQIDLTIPGSLASNQAAHEAIIVALHDACHRGEREMRERCVQFVERCAGNYLDDVSGMAGLCMAMRAVT